MRPPGQPGLAVDGLSFRYRSHAEALVDELTWTFEPATMTAITGSSGSGKSTLLFLLGLLLRPQRGEISWQGSSLDRLSDAQRSRFRAATVGFVFQDACLNPARTVEDNVCEVALYAGMSHRSARARSQELLAQFGVGLRSDHRPGEISGGQAQRVALCRALLSDPALVLADEPTGNLDAEAEGVVISALEAKARSGGVVIIATHSARVVAACDLRLDL